MLLQLWAWPCPSLKLLSPHFCSQLQIPDVGILPEHPCGCISSWSIPGGLDSDSCGPKLWDPRDLLDQGDVMGKAKGNVGSPSGSAFRRDQMNIH